MKEEDCKLCSFSGAAGCGSHAAHAPTDFSIQGLMRSRVPAASPAPLPAHPPPPLWSRQDALLLSAYLLKLGKLPMGRLPYDAAVPLSPIGYYQPAGPLIKEGGGEEARALARYHPHAPPPAPHYHHPPMLQHYGSPYYPDLCYGRYYPRPAPYLPPPQPQPNSQMVGVAGDPYPPPPPPYYPSGPCYHSTHERVPYLEYRGCPCPMNSCPKNVHIGPATGKPPNSGGPGDPLSVAVAPPGGASRAQARAAREPENITNGKDPPGAADPPHVRPHPHPHPPPFSGVSPKREMCDDFRVATDGLAAEALGPPSPARGSAGACVPQPPPAQPARRARIGKAMVRKTLVGEDTADLLRCPPVTQRNLAPPPPVAPAHDDDDVLVISSPDVECTPIDLSSSDETERRESDSHERLLDVKKENEGPEGGQTVAVRKIAPTTEAQALREHNSPCIPTQEPLKQEPPKPPVKRRYSRPKLEVEPNLELVDGRSTNGIGEHVKLQKRRKLVPETEAAPVEAETKKKSPIKKRPPKTETEPKRCNKRKSSTGLDVSPAKRSSLESKETTESNDGRLQNPAAITSKPKIKSALLLDKLIRKNSVDRDPVVVYEPDPAELFLPTVPSVLPQNGLKKVLNINNNVVDEKVVVNDTRPSDTPPRLIADKILAKIAAEKEAQKVLAKSSKSSTAKSKPLSNKNSVKPAEEIKRPKTKLLSEKTVKKQVEKKTKVATKVNLISTEDLAKALIKVASTAPEVIAESSGAALDNSPTKKQETMIPSRTEPKPADKAKLLPSKSDTRRENSPKPSTSRADTSDKNKKNETLKPKEKVNKLLCSKAETRSVEVAPMLALEEITTPVVFTKRTGARRKSTGGRRRARQASAACGTSIEDLPVPKTQPKWSNGWMWEGEPFVANVYLNNDVSEEGLRRCYSSMVHSSGDRVRRGDCILLRAAGKKGPEEPYVARVGHLWENPDDGEMMVSLVWYYRPEHTELERQPEDAPDEVFASRHRDANYVACIEDKCYVLNYYEYCRYRKRAKALEAGVPVVPSIVPPLQTADIPPGLAPVDCRVPPGIAPELVLFCRKAYDFRSKRVVMPIK